MWDHFVKNAKGDRARCIHCNKTLKVCRTTKSNFTAHLAKIHKITESQPQPKDSGPDSDLDVEIVEVTWNFVAF
jgi:BED zinc finger